MIISSSLGNKFEIVWLNGYRATNSVNLFATMAAELHNSVNLFGTMAAELHNSVNLFGTIAKELHSSLALYGTLRKANELQQHGDSSSSELTSTRTAIQHRTAA